MSATKAAPAAKKSTAKRRIGSENSATRGLMLDTVERLMREEGYAAVTSRRVARELDLKASLVHYYFPTTDDLFLAAYRRLVDDEVVRQDETQRSTQSARALWDTYRNKDRMVLGLEFMALANHRPAMRKEIALYTERNRKRRAELLASMIDLDRIEPAGISGEGLSVLLVAAARTLVMEEQLGISCGHDEAIALIQWWLDKLNAPGA